MELPEVEEQIVRCNVERVTFHNPENGWTVLQVAVIDRRKKLTVVGTMSNPRPGVEVVVRGKTVSHPKFGEQLQALSITETVPSTAEGIKKYLSSGLVKGVGEKTAERIVEAFGEDALDIIHNQPEKLSNLPGISKNKAQEIAAIVANQTDMGSILQFLVEHNVSTNLATRIYQKYKNRSLEILTKDPYSLVRQMKGIGFKTADRIALELGLALDSPVRLAAGVYYAIERASDDGHCYLTKRDLILNARQLLTIDSEVSLEDAIHALIQEKSVIEDNDRYYMKPLYLAETFVADFIAERTIPRDTPLLDELAVTEALEQAANDLGISFSAEQREAVRLANTHRLLLVTGGPGCGKTTVIRALTRFFQISKQILVLAAPTGKAAQRMSQVCDFPAGTVHRLLKYDPSSGDFLHGMHDPLIADAVIIDEASMLDLELAKDLFSAIPRNATLILVGDKDQLPSVGPGRVFAELLSTQEVKSIVLTRLYRQQEGSSITEVAHQILAGTVPQIQEPDGSRKCDSYFIPRKDQSEAQSLIVKLFTEQLPQKFGFTTADITVLTPANRGDLGTTSLNKAIQQALNPFVDNESELINGDVTFRIGDRVCQRVNNYNIDQYGVYNGDTGTVYAVSPREKTLTVELWDGRLITYKHTELHQLSLAYAITVHRSQGAEMPCVILAIHESQFTLLERQLLYTAVTRAKKLLVIVGSKQALMIGSKRATAAKRFTALKERIVKR
jgi:exodeoxyribonuclease V alpha subunit